ncbi:hypothetical protein BS297_27425 [Rhodococcus erythropolis]|uniref:Acetoacetate decarboxylase n=1 Tax=Rhodococcus erythropolis TaxID=1833 RepID=A0A0C2ZYG4_RHOER|nr:hypothetical protein BS297_27425 [Rhodococcus erythropolis]KIM17500.1 hypothetical protein QV65_04465 [Rhodococcus erythropolis]
MTHIGGMLASDQFGAVMPIHAPAIAVGREVAFSGMHSLAFRYRSDATQVAQILPKAVEIDRHPIVSIIFASYGISGFGSYLEFIQMVDCRFRGEATTYTPHIYVTSEPAMFAGREWYGWPKQLANIKFEPNERKSDGLIHATMSRPAGVECASGLFRNARRVDGIPETGAATRSMALRMIPSALPGNSPAVCELSLVDSVTYPGEIWVGDGSLRLANESQLDPLHRLPIVELLDTTLVRNASMTLTAATETYPI